MQDFYFNSFDGKPISWKKIETGRSTGKALVLFHGMGQDYFTYTNYFLNDPEYCDLFDTFYAIDLRGHGDSYKKYDDRIYFGKFSNLEKDVEIWLEKHVVPDANGKELIVFGHSLGGSIALSVMNRKKDIFTKAILSSPCIRPKFHPFEIFDFKWFVKRKWHIPHFIVRSFSYPLKLLGIEEEPGANKILWNSLMDWDVPYDKCQNGLKYDIHNKEYYDKGLEYKRSKNIKKTFPYNASNEVVLFLLDAPVIIGNYAKNVENQTLCLIPKYDYYASPEYTQYVFKNKKNVKIHIMEESKSHNVLLEKITIRNRAKDLIKQFVLN